MDYLCVAVLSEQDARLAIGQYVPQFTLLEVFVDWHGDGIAFENAEI